MHRDNKFLYNSCKFNVKKLRTLLKLRINSKIFHVFLQLFNKMGKCVILHNKI